MRDFVYSLRVRKRTLYFVVLHRVNFTIFLVGVMWYGMYKGGERYASFIYVFGIIVRMQSEKGGRHNKPHIHAIYGNEEVVVGIDGEVLEGKLPNKQMKLLLVWMAIHEEELNANWQLLSHGDGYFKIDPLR